MNIKITYNWLLEYLDTDADPYELQKYLSLCGPSVERVDKVGDDYVLDIEVTSNRVDMASVFGVAQEAQAILPQFGKKAKLKFNPIQKYIFSEIQNPAKINQSLDIKIQDENIATRITAIVLSGIKLGPSPEHIRFRLEACDVRAINNVVDISNYLMLSLGQPTHTFDYDLIKNHKMIIRKSRKGEKVVTLDNKQIILPGGDIVIEDGGGQLDGLAGIMGGLDTEIKENTKNVILFIETYNKRPIRKTSMITGQRTAAATYFEKGLDEERVEPTLVYGVELLQKYADGTVSSPVYDIYPQKYKAKTLEVSLSDITRVIGITIDAKNVQSILTNLGFNVETKKETFIITVPSWRKDDISIKEDIIEEVARVYGYHRLPNTIQTTTYIKQPPEIELLFTLQQKIKYFLKHLGLHESMNYSMISEDLIKKFNLNTADHLMLANTISEEIKYMRTTLIPSLAKNIKDNTGKQEALKFFEIAKVYCKRKDSLPDEKYKLGIAVNTSYYDLKGIIEALMRELHITNYEVRLSDHAFFSSKIQAELLINKKASGVFGEIKPSYVKSLGVDGIMSIAELDFTSLIENYKLLPSYTPPNPYAVIKLDVTMEKKSELPFSELKKIAFEKSDLLKQIEFLDLYKNKLTLRFYFSSDKKNITEEDAKKQLEIIRQAIV